MNKLKHKIKPLDMIFFKGDDFVSETIRYLEKTRLGKEAGEFSHCGIVVTSDLISHPNIEEGKLYIWESTMSGSLGNGVYNIEGKTFFGSQVRDLEKVVNAYTNAGAKVAWSKLEIEKEINKEKFQKLFEKYNGIQYDFHPLSLFGALFPCLRKTRDAVINKDWLFCSEMCFLIYQSLDYYDYRYDSKNVVPVDFLGYDEDEIPRIFAKPEFF